MVGCSALFLLFLIWIGQNWARWIISPFFALTGVGMGGRGFLFLLGVAALTIFCYLTFSPAVYAFARRQRESLSFIETLVAGAALLILLALIGSALFAFQLYKSGLEREAVEFAQLTFHRVFINRDPHFLEDHAASGKKYSRPQEFINLVDDLGEAKSVGPFSSKLTYQIDGYSLRVAGTVRTRVLFTTDGVWVTVQVEGSHNQWEVVHLAFDY